MPPGSRADLRHVVVVGGGLGGARSCEQLRAQGFAGRITLVGLEADLPYDRPPLSKAVLSGARDDTALNTDLPALDVTCRLGVGATSLRPGDRIVETTAGDIGYDGLIIATGARPVRLPGDGAQNTLRTIHDARQLRDRLVPGARVVIVGAGWIGAEVATTALARRCRVTCVEACSAPLGQALGGEVGTRLLGWWSGVRMMLGAAVDHVAENVVHLADGTDIPADVVIAGVGVRPETQWLLGSGLALDRGVVVDEHLAAQPGIVAVGDVAAWRSRRWRRTMHVEHWDNASAGPRVAVATLLNPDDTEAAIYDPIPYFWSDQFGRKLQYLGHHSADSSLVIRTHPDSAWWSAAWLDGEGRLSAMLVIDRPRDMLAARKLIEAGEQVDARLLADGTVALADVCGSTRPLAVADRS